MTAEVEAILEGAAGERLDGFGDGPMQTTEVGAEYLEPSTWNARASHGAYLPAMASWRL